MIAALARRHMRVFFRDPAAVFFSLLSALILFVLYTVFLGTLQETTLAAQVPGASATQVSSFVHSWMFAGIVMISTMTTNLSALSVFVGDRVSNRFRDFLISPLSRFQLVTSYLIAAVIVSLVMSTIVLAVSQLYMWLVDGAVLGWAQLAQSFGYLVVFCVLFSAIWSFIITLVKSNSVFMSLGTIVGTAGGFLCGAFITVGSLPSGLVSFMNFLPFNQAATLMRKPFTEHTANVIADGNVNVLSALRQEYGMNISIGDAELVTGTVLAIFAALVVVFVRLGTWRIGRRVA